MHTVEEAKELWCPMVRSARREEWHEAWDDYEVRTYTIVGGCNTDALGRNRVPGSCRCIADKCAMWRWSRKRTVARVSVLCHNPDAKAEPARPAGLPPDFVFVPHEPLGEPACWQEPDESYAARVRLHGEGYCGLAGNPVAN